MTTETGFIEVDGYKLHYIVEGNGPTAIVKESVTEPALGVVANDAWRISALSKQPTNAEGSINLV